MLNPGAGTFSWNINRQQAANNADDNYPDSEGISVCNRQLQFVSKSRRLLYNLNLAASTYTETSTESGDFNNNPDQVSRMKGQCDVLYFAEDGGSNNGRK